MAIEYYLLKGLFFAGLVRSFVRYDPLQDHPIALAALYTAGVSFLSYVFFLSPLAVAPWRTWEIWLGETFLLSALYFRLLARFEEGLLFWTLLLAGGALVLF